jgi:hypothetical protein
MQELVAACVPFGLLALVGAFFWRRLTCLSRTIAIGFVVLGAMSFASRVTMIYLSPSYPATISTPAPIAQLPAYIAPTDTPRPYSSPIPTPTPLPTPYKMAVCVPLAYGHEYPMENSRALFQMSQDDGWFVFVYGFNSGWYVVGHNNAPAYMKLCDLCPIGTPPDNYATWLMNQQCK